MSEYSEVESVDLIPPRELTFSVRNGRFVTLNWTGFDSKKVYVIRNGRYYRRTRNDGEFRLR